MLDTGQRDQISETGIRSMLKYSFTASDSLAMRITFLTQAHPSEFVQTSVQTIDVIGVGPGAEALLLDIPRLWARSGVSNVG